MSSQLLSPKEVQDLKRMCNDPFLELGMTLRPKHLKCFEPAIATNNVEVTILFKKHVDAEKWNEMHEARIRKSGHIATVALSALVGLLCKNYSASVAVGSATAITKDELQARIWYPEMFEGWILKRQYTFRYEQFPHQNFYMTWVDRVIDNVGKEMEKRVHGQSHFAVGGSYGIPEKIIRILMTKDPHHTLIYN